MQRIVKLSPPQFSSEYIKEKITCIRAHREREFRIGCEIINAKLICHNYGQGGAGLTFLFSSVHRALREFNEFITSHSHFKNQPIVVIGAGCYGLLTAIELARAGYTVRIVASEVERPSSFNAAGFFFPRSRKTSTPQERALFHELGLESYAVYKKIIAGEHAFMSKNAARILPVYYGPNIDPGYDFYITHGMLEPAERVTLDFDTGKQYEALEYKALFIDANQLFADLHREINKLGIPIMQADVATFTDLLESIIFNCAGIGAKQLTGDKKLIPVQGHLIMLKDQPKLGYMLNMQVTMRDEQGNERDELIYYSPRGAGTLGITFIRGKRSLVPNEHEFDRILQRCHDFFGE